MNMMLSVKIRKKITYVKKIDVAFLGIVLVMFLVLIGVIFFVSNNLKENQEIDVENAMKIQSQGYKEKFETFIDEKVELLKGIAKFPMVTCMNTKKQSELLKNRSKDLGFEHIFVMDMEGKGFYIDEGITRDQSDEPFFYNVSANHVYVTEPFYAEKLVITTVCVSIFDIKNEKIGSLCGAVKLDSIRNVLVEADALLEGELFMVNSDGIYVAAKNMKKVYDKQCIYNEEKSDYSLVKKAFEEKKDKTGYITIEGVDYKAQVSYLRNYNWVIIQTVEKAKIYDDVKYIDSVKYAALAVVATLIGCVARIAFHWRRSVQRINTDTLTGCNSRAAMEALIDSVDKEIKKEVTLIYLDLNKFKYVNDTYGHDVGDKVLKIYSKSLMKIFGRVGYVGRMGGDEFMVILTGISKDIAKKLCKKLEEVLVEDSKELDFEYTISTSYGIATRERGSFRAIEDVMVEADEKMYAFKEAHRHER